MKPQSVRMFDWLYFLSLALSLIEMVFVDGREESETTLEFVVISAVVVVFAILLWFFISQRASIFARWLFLLLVGAGLAVTAFTFAETLAGGWIAVAMAVAIAGLDVLSGIMLLRPDARRWFDSGGRLVEIDPDVFS